MNGFPLSKKRKQELLTMMNMFAIKATFCTLVLLAFLASCAHKLQELEPTPSTIDHSTEDVVNGNRLYQGNDVPITDDGVGISDSVSAYGEGPSVPEGIDFPFVLAESDIYLADGSLASVKVQVTWAGPMRDLAYMYDANGEIIVTLEDEAVTTTRIPLILRDWNTYNAIPFADYNGDGNPDFCIQTGWAGSSNTGLQMFSINMQGEVFELDINECAYQYMDAGEQRYVLVKRNQAEDRPDIRIHLPIISVAARLLPQLDMPNRNEICVEVHTPYNPMFLHYQWNGSAFDCYEIQEFCMVPDGYSAPLYWHEGH